MSTRRKFFGKSGALLAASALPVPASEPAIDYYDKLGVTKMINAAGT